MIKWLFKYGIVIYLFNTVFLSISSTFSLGFSIYIFIMILLSFLIIINPKKIQLIIFHKAFSFFLILNLINIFYWLFFHSFSDYEAGKYLVARGIQFSIISFSVYYNFDYFKEMFFNDLSYIILAVIIIGLIINPFIFSGRYSGIVWNPNMLSSFSCIAFAALFLGKKNKNNFDLCLLILFLIISLATGSRGVIVGIALAFIIKYRFSIRNFIYALLAFSTYFIIITMNLDTSVNRFASQGLLNDRLLQFQYAYETVMQKPFFGFGLDKYAYINPEIIPYYLRGHIISAHNGYLAVFAQYGFIFGFLVLGIIFYQTFRFYIKIDKNDSAQLFYLFIVIYGLIGSFYETLITGINNFHTILFWFSFGFLSYSIYKKEYGN